MHQANSPNASSAMQRARRMMLWFIVLIYSTLVVHFRSTARRKRQTTSDLVYNLHYPIEVQVTYWTESEKVRFKPGIQAHEAHLPSRSHFCPA